MWITALLFWRRRSRAPCVSLQKRPSIEVTNELQGASKLYIFARLCDWICTRVPICFSSPTPFIPLWSTFVLTSLPWSSKISYYLLFCWENLWSASTKLKELLSVAQESLSEDSVGCTRQWRCFIQKNIPICCLKKSISISLSPFILSLWWLWRITKKFVHDK